MVQSKMFSRVPTYIGTIIELIMSPYRSNNIASWLQKQLWFVMDSREVIEGKNRQNMSTKITEKYVNKNNIKQPKRKKKILPIKLYFIVKTIGQCL